ncbi:MAG TPA: SDR family oxidoreductase, partial [Myxococcota bacterium]|nr:SDR family oxidoreductase [Myxococcota bacterium]
PQKLRDAAKTLKNGFPYQGDVSKTGDLDRFYKEVAQKFGKIDVLVANAGIAEPRPIYEVDEKFFNELVDVDFKGVYFTVQRALPYLNKDASVILIASVAGHVGWPGHSVYSSIKAAVSYLARSFAAELIPQGIRVNSISPGFVDTPIFDKAKAIDPDLIENFSTIIPMKRFAKPEEIANAALFLASPQASYIVGVDLVVDGGITATFPAAKLLPQKSLSL